MLLVPDATVDTVTVHITYLVGSRHEGYGEKGMAHLLEHMLFKGSPRFPDVKPEFTRRGARWNGTTAFDRTNYFETLPASEENLDWALAFEADRMVNASVRKEDLDSEMTVVRNEFERGENNPGSVLNQRMQQLAFAWHNYGNAIIGARARTSKMCRSNGCAASTAPKYIDASTRPDGPDRREQGGPRTPARRRGTGSAGWNARRHPHR